MPSSFQINDKAGSSGLDNLDATISSRLATVGYIWSVSGAALTVTKEDDTTASWTSTLTSSASADPVTGSDPA